MKKIHLSEYVEILETAGYTVLRELGKGEQGCVLLVKQEGKNKLYACKISEDIGRLKAEGEVLGRLHHPGFPGFIGLWVTGMWGFLLMEYVEGENLAECLCRDKPLGVRELFAWGMELAEALCVLHDMPEIIIYRDLKPENIMIRKDGRLKLVDLGCACARNQAEKSVAGTLEYAAPEQFQSPQSVSECSDVYAWGKIMRKLSEKCMPVNWREYLIFYRIKRLLKKCCNPQMEVRPMGMRVVLEAIDRIDRKNRTKVPCKKKRMVRNAQKNVQNRL